MATIKPSQNPLDDKIEFFQIIQFFKANFKRVIIFSIVGGILGAFYGKFAGPVYEGTMLIEPAQVAGNYVVKPTLLITKAYRNSFYSRETLLACNNSTFFKDKNIDYNIKDLLKIRLTKDNSIMNFSISDKSKDFITVCFNAIENDIKLDQASITKDSIEIKKNEIQSIQNSIQVNENLRKKILLRQPKNLKINQIQYSNLIIDFYILANITSEDNKLKSELHELTYSLSPIKTRNAAKVLPISFEEKVFPSPILGLLLGLLLGSALGLFLIHFKKN